jgi:hypothetical protein
MTIAQYLNTPEADRNFAEGVALLEAANHPNKTQLNALKSYANRKYVNQQTKTALYIALRRQVTGDNKQATPPPKSETRNPKSAPPLSIYAILESDPIEIKDLITQTGRMHDEAFANRNALIHINSKETRHEYALKAVQLYRKAAENWQKVKIYRQTGAMPPELTMTTNGLKKMILEKLDRKKYIIERTYRLQSWIDGKTKPPNNKHEPEKWKTEYEEKIEELNLINEWLNIE